MLEITIEKELHEKLIKFANSKQKIKAIFKGTDPEDGGTKYWFILGKENIT